MTDTREHCWHIVGRAGGAFPGDTLVYQCCRCDGERLLSPSSVASDDAPDDGPCAPVPFPEDLP